MLNILDDFTDPDIDPLIFMQRELEGIFHQLKENGLSDTYGTNEWHAIDYTTHIQAFEFLVETSLTDPHFRSALSGAEAKEKKEPEIVEKKESTEPAQEQPAPENTDTKPEQKPEKPEAKVKAKPEAAAVLMHLANIFLGVDRNESVYWLCIGKDGSGESGEISFSVIVESLVTQELKVVTSYQELTALKLALSDKELPEQTLKKALNDKLKNAIKASNQSIFASTAPKAELFESAISHFHDWLKSTCTGDLDTSGDQVYIDFYMKQIHGMMKLLLESLNQAFEFKDIEWSIVDYTEESVFECTTIQSVLEILRPFITDLVEKSGLEIAKVSKEYKEFGAVRTFSDFSQWLHFFSLDVSEYCEKHFPKKEIEVKATRARKRRATKEEWSKKFRRRVIDSEDEDPEPVEYHFRSRATKNYQESDFEDGESESAESNSDESVEEVAPTRRSARLG